MDDIVHKIDDLQGKVLVYNTSFFDDYKEPGLPQHVLAFVYASLFTVGLLGNLWAMFSVAYRLLQPQCDKRHILLFVLCLSVVDTLCLSFLPIIIIDMLSPYWKFSVLTCKLLWSCESPSKILSTFLLAALSANCYLAVCKPDLYRRWKKRRPAAFVMSICAIVSLTCMTPIYMFSNVYVLTVSIGDGDYYSGEASPGEASPGLVDQGEDEVLLVAVQKCMFYTAEAWLRVAFITYIFLIGFCLTSVLQFIFYGMLLMHILQHKSNFSRSRVSLGRITKTVMSLGAFHMACWLPYWSCTLLLIYQEQSPAKIISYIVHTLPYLNAAVNPTLYLQLNSACKEETLTQCFQRKLRQFQRYSTYRDTSPRLTSQIIYQETTSTVV